MGAPVSVMVCNKSFNGGKMSLETLTFRELADYNRQELEKTVKAYNTYIQQQGTQRISLRQYMTTIYYPQHDEREILAKYLIARTRRGLIE
jgi:iron uptake system EfeUOB component EfeO/EfeM